VALGEASGVTAHRRGPLGLGAALTLGAVLTVPAMLIVGIELLLDAGLVALLHAARTKVKPSPTARAIDRRPANGVLWDKG